MYALIAVAIVAIFMIATMPQPKAPPAAGIDEFDIPTVDPGRNVPVLFGTKLIKSSMTVWYGDLRSEKIRK